MTLRRFLVMNGYAGLRRSRKKRRERNISREHMKNLLKENADLAAGPDANVVDVNLIENSHQ